LHWFNLSAYDEQTAVAAIVRHLQSVLEGSASWGCGVHIGDAPAG
jgi:hypothetical protein